jgi:hypothetical protein
MKWHDPRFVGYSKENGLRLPPHNISPAEIAVHKNGNRVPIYNLIPVPTGKRYSYKGKH